MAIHSDHKGIKFFASCMTNVDHRSCRIQELAAEIRRLSLELDSLLLVTNSPPSLPRPLPRASVTLSSAPLSDFPLGSCVEILNSCNSLQGQRGTIVRTNSAFVFFHLDSSGELVWCSRHNLRPLP